jgi:hypothetical protein
MKDYSKPDWSKIYQLIHPEGSRGPIILDRHIRTAARASFLKSVEETQDGRFKIRVEVKTFDGGRFDEPHKYSFKFFIEEFQIVVGKVDDLFPYFGTEELKKDYLVRPGRSRMDTSPVEGGMMPISLLQYGSSGKVRDYKEI